MRLEALFNSQSGGAPPICPWEPPKSGAELEGRGSYGSVASALKRYLTTGVGPRRTQVSENNECTSSEPGGRARQPESCRRHCRLSRACRRENPRSIRLRGPEIYVPSDLPVRGRRRSWPRQPTWVLHNFSARAIKRTTSPAMLLVLMGSAIVWRAAAAQSRVSTP